MRYGRLAVVILVGGGLVAPPAFGAPATTVQRTIRDTDGDQRLEYAEGEDTGLRLRPQDSIINFLQLSDFQTVDEESPARVEWLDGTQRAPGLQPFSAAYRPQEALSTQVVESMVRQARNTVSPVTAKPLD